MRLVWHGEKVTQKAMTGADAFCSQVAKDIVREAKLGMKGPRSGAVPPQGKRIPGWIRQRSAPGEPPAVQSQRLVGSIVAEKLGLAKYRAGTNVDYGFWLELGTRRIRPRPWLRPALMRVRQKMKVGGQLPKGWGVNW